MSCTYSYDEMGIVQRYAYVAASGFAVVEFRCFVVKLPKEALNPFQFRN